MIINLYLCKGLQLIAKTQPRTIFQNNNKYKPILWNNQKLR
ncbi:hypothetical protein THERMOS_1091 [Bathymodiolus thermophilus thioautotrophic gill symbiont]|uniref:Uncharacterized protein n=1 Tax=Bathymodiolus thermophilus thioautotrophic gill symbiont TaxID=2360 RepID=A0A8H9CFM2_9GAMM|nr:hypothetical protein THERMOS_1091 [Bathymodiolus thermophilus thioautotrophic gill symbiont]